MTQFRGHGIVGGRVLARAVVSTMPFGFWQGIDPKTGLVIDRRHDTFEQSLAGRIFIFPYGRGSTGTPGVFLEAVKNGNAPLGLINIKSEAIVTICAILAEEFCKVQVPLIDQVDPQLFERIRTGDLVEMDGDEGWVRVLDGESGPAAGGRIASSGEAEA